MPQLIFYIQKDYPRVHDLVNEKTTIGRGRKSDVVVGDSRVSVAHAEINRGNDGSYLLTDLGSRNGTTVNGRPADGTVLSDGDKIKFGTVKAVFLTGEKMHQTSMQGAMLAENDSVELDQYLQTKAVKLAQLEETIENRTRALDTMKVSRSDLKELKKASGDLKERVEAERENLLSLQKELKASQQKQLELQAGVKDREKKIQSLNREFDELKAESSRKKKEVESSTSQKEKLDTEVANLKKEIEEAKADLEARKRESEEAAIVFEDVKAAEQRLVGIKTDLKNRESKIEELKNEISLRDIACINLGKEITTREKASEDLSREIAGRQKALIDLGKEITTREKACESIANEITAREKAYEERGVELATREKALIGLGKEITTREKAGADLVGEIERQKEALTWLEASIASKQKVADQIAAEASENNEVIRSFGERVKAVETKLRTSLDELSTAQKAQKALRVENHSLSKLVGEKAIVLEQFKKKIISRRNGTEGNVPCPPLRVINQDMRSLVHYFHHGAGIPDQERVNPIGYYALAACTRGSMHREADTIPAGEDPVLILLHGDLEKDRELIESSCRVLPGRIILVCWREGQLSTLKAERKGEGLKGLGEILTGVSGIVSVDTQTAKLIDELKVNHPHLNIPLPCPVESPEWNLSSTTGKRSRGVFVAGDGFDPGLILHRARVELLNQLVADTECTVTLYQNTPQPVEGLNIPKKLLFGPAGPFPYGKYLALVREHRLVTGFGTDLTGSEIKGDSLLARALFIGGEIDNATDELLFPETCIKGDDIGKALKNTTRFLSDPGAYAEAVERTQNLAPQLLSFETVSDRLNEFFHFISANPTPVS